MKNLLVLLHLFADSAHMGSVTDDLKNFNEVKDLYEVTGEYDIVAIIEVKDILEFRELLKDKILKVKGVKSTVSSVVMKISKKDGKIVD